MVAECVTRLPVPQTSPSGVVPEKRKPTSRSCEAPRCRGSTSQALVDRYLRPIVSASRFWPNQSAADGNDYESYIAVPRSSEIRTPTQLLITTV